MSTFLEEAKTAVAALRDLEKNVERQLWANIRGLFFAVGVIGMLLFRIVGWLLLVAAVVALWLLFVAMLPLSLLSHGVQWLWTKISKPNPTP